MNLQKQYPHRDPTTGAVADSCLFTNCGVGCAHVIGINNSAIQEAHAGASQGLEPSWLVYGGPGACQLLHTRACGDSVSWGRDIRLVSLADSAVRYMRAPLLALRSAG
jgi:hypothetical protein